MKRLGGSSTSGPFALALALSFVGAAPALAESPSLEAAQAAEARFEPRAAVARYEELIAAAPSSRQARKAEARLAWLRARSEGAYAPLARLMSVQALRGPAITLEAIRVFEAEARVFPPGRVRAESLSLVADAYLQQLDRPAEALLAYRAWSELPELGPAERRLAESGVALSLGRLGELDAALVAVHDAGIMRRPEAVYLEVQRFSRAARPIAWTAIVAFGLSAILGGALRGFRVADVRRAFGLRRIALAAYLLGPPILLLWRYDAVLLGRFLPVTGALGLSLGLVSLLGARLARQPLSPRRRATLAVLGALATVGVAVLVMDALHLFLSMGLSGLRSAE